MFTDTHTQQQLENNRIVQLKHLAMRDVFGFYFFSVSLRFLNLPSEDTVFCSRSISDLVYRTHKTNLISFLTSNLKLISNRWTPFPNLFADFCPGLLQPVDGAAVKS